MRWVTVNDKTHSLQQVNQWNGVQLVVARAGSSVGEHGGRVPAIAILIFGRARRHRPYDYHFAYVVAFVYSSTYHAMPSSCKVSLKKQRAT